MSTRVYGASDDLVEFEGDVFGEVGCFGTESDEHGPIRVTFSDGTVLKVGYCLRVPGVWGIGLVTQGPLFVRIEACDDEDADPYSDQAYFSAGLTGATWSWPGSRDHEGEMEVD